METRGIHLEAASVLIFELEGAPRKLMEVATLAKGISLGAVLKGAIRKSQRLMVISVGYKAQLKLIVEAYINPTKDSLSHRLHVWNNY